MPVAEAEEILRRAEGDITLSGFSEESLRAALAQAYREIHRYAIQRELDRRKSWSRKKNKGIQVDSDFYKHGKLKGRCPTKRSLR